METKTVSKIAVAAKGASLELAGLPGRVKNTALEAMALALEENLTAVLEANRLDLESAKVQNLAGPLVARLALDDSKVKGMVAGIRSVAALPDPVGRQLSVMEMDKDLVLYRESCPIGVIGAIFESRPDAVPQITSLCLKSGNAVVLKGGSEAQHSNKLVVNLLAEAAGKIKGVPQAAIQMIETRSEVAEMLQQDSNINLVIPRGSNQFVRYIQDNTRIPILGHSEGICHGYIDQEADIDKALPIVLDAKLQYAAACNAMETLLVHRAVAADILPALFKKFSEKKVEMVGCPQTCKLFPEIKPAENGDWDREYNDLKLSLKIVDGLEEAIQHINTHSSGHTDTIVTQNQNNAERFMNEVDSASVIWNASTRFADGFRYGLGAEVGISTNKTHARGPVGLEGLVIYKFKLVGNGHTVADYTGEQAKTFTHKPLKDSD